MFKIVYTFTNTTLSKKTKFCTKKLFQSLLTTILVTTNACSNRYIISRSINEYILKEYNVCLSGTYVRKNLTK